MAKIATRAAYGKALARIILEDENIVVLDADLTKSTNTNMAAKACPERHFNMGIAEQNMMSVAAGLAASDKTVFASTFAMFAAGRAFEQVRNSICYPKLNVKVCATHSGLMVGEDGASHQAIEDIALMRAIPEMIVIQPADEFETEAVIEYAAKYKGPMYVRLGRAAVEAVYDENYQFELGKGSILKKGSKVAVLATGAMVQESIVALELLKESGIEPTLVNIHTIKPLDVELIIELAQTHDFLVTCEEHNVIGGLGSAVSEVLVKNHPKKLVMIGIEDQFGESGKPEMLFEKHGLDGKSVAKRIQDEL